MSKHQWKVIHFPFGEFGMNKNNKKFLSSIVVALLLSSIAYIIIPIAAAEETIPQQKELSLMNDVIGFDLQKYTANRTAAFSDLYLDILPQENVRYLLDSKESKVDISYIYTNRNLRLISVLETQGTPSMTKLVTKTQVLDGKTVQALDELATAKNFLNDYSTHSGKVLYGELAAMLNTVKDAENLTKTSGDIKLEITNVDNSRTYRWIYSVNGFDAPDKCVAIRYKDGFLKYFADTWDLYQVGTASVNISEKQAISAALESAKLASWQMGSGDNIVEVKNFTAANAMLWETVFRSSLIADEPRNKDTLTLYPMYHVWVSLDKFYPGNVYGFNVYVWADTGKIAAINERAYTLDAPENLMATATDFAIEPLNGTAYAQVESSALSAFPSFTFPAIAAAILSAIPIWLLHCKKRNLPKQRSKIIGVMLCLVISSSVLLLPISVATAEPIRRATIWGSESTGDTSYYGASGRKTAGEIAWQNQLANYVAGYFSNDGYYASDLQGSSGSYKSQILAQIESNENGYSNVAVLDLDHGVGRSDYQGMNEFHYMFEDNIGQVTGVAANGSDPNNWVNTNMVYDMDIYGKTTPGKTCFAFINTCLSGCINSTIYDANGNPQVTGLPAGGGKYSGTNNAVGMPYAWTHRIVREKGTGFDTSVHMSKYGYADPDNGQFVYLGFPWGSAALDQSISGSSYDYYYWIQDFFYGALASDISVNQALDFASQARFSNQDFDQIDLYTSFNALWPMWSSGSWSNTEFSNSKLAVYGNGNIHLYEYFVHDPYTSQSYSGSGLVSSPNSFTGAQPNGGYTRLRAIQVNDQAMVVGSMGTSSTYAHGNIYVYGYSSSYTSRLRVYASYYSGSGWQPVSDTIISPGSAHWINCGTYSSNFRYLSFVVYRQSTSDYSNDVYLDSVVVIPPIS
jgi:hypothetical protein